MEDRNSPIKQKIESLIQKGEIQSALILINEQIHQNPDTKIWYRLKLYALEELHRIQEIQKIIPIIHEKFPNSVESAIAQSFVPGLYMQEKNRRLKSARKLDQEDPFLPYVYGKFCYFQGRDDLAIHHFQVCISKTDNFFLAKQYYRNCLKNRSV